LAAPQLVSISPDSGSLGYRGKEVIFHFDEVVAERPPSSTTLSDLFFISPRNGAVNASWHRDAISVRPSRGWRPNTPYTVIMQKGVADIRGNVRNTGATTFFATGTFIPHTLLAGNVFDWVSGSPATGAIVEAYVPPDTLHPYMAVVDSAGSFAIVHLPAGRYTVRAYTDRNKNLSIEPSEQWDSVGVILFDSVRTDLVIFTHDTIPPRIREVAASDSVTLQVTFDKPVDPKQTLTASNFAVIGPDSAPIPIVRAGAPPRDTVAPVNPAVPPVSPAVPIPPAPPAAADTTPKSTRRVMPVPIPITEAVIKLQRPLLARTAYRVRAIGIRGLLGRTGDSERVYTLPPPPAPAPATQKPGQNPPGQNPPAQNPPVAEPKPPTKP